MMDLMFCPEASVAVNLKSVLPRSYGIEHRHKLRNVELQGFLSDDFVFGLKP